MAGTRTTEKNGGKDSLALDVDELRRRLGPSKVALIDRWIREVNGRLDAVLAAHAGADTVLLDVGCSRGDPDLPSTQRAAFFVGCDVDLPGLRANAIAHAVAMAPFEALPFADGSFHVILAKWVLEHLEVPEQALGECWRVLKPGGVLVALTPNAHSLFTFVSRLLPYRLKQVFKGNLFGVHEEDTFRTWYRANTPSRLARLTRSAGFATEGLDLIPGMWTFFIFSAPIATLVRRLEHIQARIPGLRVWSAYIMGVWRKVSPDTLERGRMGGE